MLFSLQIHILLRVAYLNPFLTEILEQNTLVMKRYEKMQLDFRQPIFSVITLYTLTWMQIEALMIFSSTRGLLLTDALYLDLLMPLCII